MYIINSLRFLAVILLVSILIIKEIPFKKVVKDAMIQFYLALTCILILLVADNILGFILSICLLTLYFRIYTSELKSIKATSGSPERPESRHGEVGHICNGSADTADKCEMNMVTNLNADRKVMLATGATTGGTTDGLAPYITEENLLSAQSNVVNPQEYNKEVQGGDKGNVYGSQGLDTKNIHVRGYDTNSVYLGSLSYDIL
jgi:Ca2+/Na+ antiporter